MPIFPSPSRYLAWTDTPSAVTGVSRVSVPVGTPYRIGDRGDSTLTALYTGRGRGRDPARGRCPRPLPLAGGGDRARGPGLGRPPAVPRPRLPGRPGRAAGGRSPPAAGDGRRGPGRQPAARPLPLLPAPRR